MTGRSSSDPEDLFGTYLEGRTPEVRRELTRLRDLILRIAVSHPDMDGLTETLKWGEPSYRPRRNRIGSSVRLAATRDGRAAMQFICHTGLIARFRELYPETFVFEGNRSILFKPGLPFDEAALSHCVTMALTYHVGGRDY